MGCDCVGTGAGLVPQGDGSQSLPSAAPKGAAADAEPFRSKGGAAVGDLKPQPLSGPNTAADEDEGGAAGGEDICMVAANAAAVRCRGERSCCVSSLNSSFMFGTLMSVSPGNRRAAPNVFSFFTDPLSVEAAAATAANAAGSCGIR